MTVLDLIFPPRCPYCGELTGTITESCDKCLPAKNVNPHRTQLSSGTECISAFRYSGSARDAILNYKYHGCRQYGKSFVYTYLRLISDCYGAINFDVYTSVPAQRDFAYRRFDHMKLIAKAAAKQNHVDYGQLLIKDSKGNNVFQHSLPAEERAKNAESSYRLFENADIKGRTVLMFDDVITTGATLNVCAGILLSNGAEQVKCITLLW